MNHLFSSSIHAFSQYDWQLNLFEHWPLLDNLVLYILVHVEDINQAGGKSNFLLLSAYKQAKKLNRVFATVEN